MQKISRQRVAEMFNRIAGRYDLLNRILSLGLDSHWRKKMGTLLPQQENLFVVDLATGTCDQIISLSHDSRIDKFLGIDISSEMLSRGKQKLLQKNLQKPVQLSLGSALSIPLSNESADVTTISFGIRNVTDPLACLKEMHRTLKPGGAALILEFSHPSRSWIIPFHLFYLRHVLPFIGRIISRDREAYRYLNQTIEEFPSGEAFLDLMKTAGFKNTEQKPLSFGVVTLYKGVR